MDSIAYLALMAKAKRVFESADTFLSFPGLSPISKTPDELRFGSTSDMTPEDLSEASEFARITNQIQRGVLASIDEGEYLWEVYRDVLRTARVAQSTPNATQSAAYDAAIKTLYTTDANGFRVDSDQLRAYKQHRDAVIEAQEDYKNHQLSAETATDPAVLERWTTVEEPALRAIVAEREAAWATEGFKDAIETAQGVEIGAAASAAATIWNEWRTSFVSDLDLQTDTAMIDFAVTGYAPNDVVDADDWPQFTLTKDEIATLVAEAPPELRDIFAQSGGASDIEEMSFEYRSVSVTRPWFRPAVFRSRIWQLPPGSEPLSDGAVPPTGRCPGYVAALVFARNIVVKHRETSDGGQHEVGPARVFLKLDAAMLNPMLAAAVLKKTDAGGGFVRNPGMFEPNKVAFDGSRAALRLRGGSFAASELARATPMRVAATVIAAPSVSSAAVVGSRNIGALRLSGTAFRPGLTSHVAVALPAQPEPASEPAPEPAPAPPPTTSPPTERPGEITILAFICKRVPRAPDPDPALFWA